jgi:hypothetical protein
MLSREVRGSSYAQNNSMAPFNLFVQRHKERLELENPECSAIDIFHKLAAAWACLSPQEKMAYYDDGYEKFSAYCSFPTEDPAKPHSPDSANLSEAIVHSALLISSLEQPQEPGSYLSWLGAQVVRSYYAEHHELPRGLVAQFGRGVFATLKTSNELAEIAGTLNLRGMIGPTPNP